MRLLLDNNLSPKLVSLLTDAGHDVAHVRDHDMAAAADSSVLAFATETQRVLVSADTDFSILLARTHATSPSFVLVLSIVEEDLEAVVVLGNDSLRIRRLPIP